MVFNGLLGYRGVMSDLARRDCVPCRGGVPPLESEETSRLLAELDPAWRVVAQHHLHREYRFPDFKTALAFTNHLGEIAERQGHHPDILLGWGKVGVDIWTHKIDGLTESDFILAAKSDEAYPAHGSVAG